MSKILEMPKSKSQLWSDLFRGRKLETTKYNKAEFDDLFNGFKRDIDRRQSQLLARAQSSDEHALGPAEKAYRQAQEIVNLDDLGIILGGKR